jgi:hypothetical protein
LATYVWEINDVDAGEGIGWDFLDIAGSLTINATSENRFIIDVRSLTLGNEAGAVHDFSNMESYSWRIAHASGGITGFDAMAFDIQTDEFTYPDVLGLFEFELSGNDLFLTYAAVPEPSTIALLALGGVGLMMGMRRRKMN